mgnify:CR=1 FL=1
MKKFLKKALISALAISCIALFGGFGGNVSEVVFKSTPKYGFVFNPEKDLFQQFKTLMPGDVRTQNITVKNDIYNDVNIYLRAEEDYSTIENAEQKHLVQNLLKMLKIKVTNTHNGKDTLLYEGPLNGIPDGTGTGDMSKDILLGAYGYQQSANLSVQLVVPSSLGNEYESMMGGIKWIFTAEIIPYDDDDDDDDNGGSGDGGVKAIAIEPQKYETEVPKDNPLMGTDSKAAFYFTAAACAAAGIVLTLKKPKAKK